jgi:hypothetical protein
VNPLPFDPDNPGQRLAADPLVHCMLYPPLVTTLPRALGY